MNIPSHYYTNNYSNGFQPGPSAPTVNSPKEPVYKDLYWAYNAQPSAPPVTPPSRPIYSNLYPDLTASAPQVTVPLTDKKITKIELDLNDECSLCLEEFKNKTEGDTRSVRLLSETDCHHFFHKFCLDDHLENGMNDNCPMCRHPIGGIKEINLDKKDLNAEQGIVLEGQTLDPLYDDSGLMTEALQKVGNTSLSILSGVASLAFGTAKFALSSLVGLGKFGFNSMATSPEKLQSALERSTFKVYKEWEKTVSDVETLMRKNKEEISTLLATINSLPISRHHQAMAAIQRFEASAKMYKEEILEIQEALMKSLNEEKKLIS